MDTTHHRSELPRPARAALLLAAALQAAASAGAADVQAQGDAQARYQRERSVCLSGLSNQDRATCLREARAALGEARLDGMDDPAMAPYASNARQRCERLPADDRRACAARLQRRDVAPDSIYRGLVLRETIAPDPAPAAGDTR
jgi:hypothetical protein